MDLDLYPLPGSWKSPLWIGLDINTARTKGKAQREVFGAGWNFRVSKAPRTRPKPPHFAPERDFMESPEIRRMEKPLLTCAGLMGLEMH